MEQVVFITGVSSGFGKAIYQALRSEGYRVYGSSRRPMGDDPQVIPMDVRDADSVKRGIDHIVACEGRLDVLINNAGIGLAGPLEMFDEEEMRAEMETNFLGSVRVTRAVLPHMRANGGGRILTLSSIAGLMGIPFQGHYAASKFALEGFMESLRYEVSRFNIHIVMVNPGDFQTEFTANRKPMKRECDAAYSTMYDNCLQVITQDETTGLKPGKLARKIVQILKQRNPKYRYVVATAEQKLAVILHKFLPATWFNAILRKHYKLP